MQPTLYIAVVGGGTCDPDTLRRAERVGQLLAERGAVLVCGGLGGVMEGACRGARAKGGTTVGFLPTTARSSANPYVSVALPTGLGEARNTLVVRASDALIAIGGEFGTLSEIAFALKVGVPVVGLDTWELAKHGGPVQAIHCVANPAEAVARALQLAAGAVRATS